jgi:hypothetical protein
VDARGPFLMMQAAAAKLADGGCVINISSGVTSAALPGSALYSGVKAFVDQVTRVAAAEFAARRITVNAIAPGSTATGPFAGLSAEQRAELGPAFSLGRIGEPADTAALAAFLSSDEAGFITGQVIYNTGGQHRPVGRARCPAGLRLASLAGSGGLAFAQLAGDLAGSPSLSWPGLAGSPSLSWPGWLAGCRARAPRARSSRLRAARPKPTDPLRSVPGSLPRQRPGPGAGSGLPRSAGRRG